MSTRSVVAVPQGDGWRGRYCHSDGYPTYNGRVLHALVRRDGVKAVIKRLTEDRYGWSSLNSNQPEIEGVMPSIDAEYGTPEYCAAVLGKGGMYGDGRFANETGYGIAYTTHKGQSSSDNWITHEDADTDTEWCYVITERGIAVYVNAGEWRQVTFASHDGDIDWESVEKAGDTVEWVS